MQTNDIQVNENQSEVQNDEQKERVAHIDFKMVTFSLSGKDYGVDIMNVKEIAKAGKFTYVPNAAPYLRGVYNLRGDIIPIVDLRVFFHLPAERKQNDALENMLILRLEDHVFGIIVDHIDKVVGIASTSIQPPHPIFGDINIKYIRGVVENQSRLYIILDVLRIFAQKEEEKPRVMSETPSGAYYRTTSLSAQSAEQEKSYPDTASGSEMEFIKETLFAIKRFSATEINEDWMARRFEEWKKIRAKGDLQLKNAEEADEYLSDFYSPYSDKFWGDEYAEAIQAYLPDFPSKNINVWNPGCGKGYETFSFACILQRRYPESRIKIWANDSDLLAISSAPNLFFDIETVPEYCREFLVQGRNGYSFNQLIKDSVLFEYHDIQNANPFPELDIVLARDILSFLAPVEQARVFGDFSEKLKASGIIFLGRNETLRGEDWKSVGQDPVSAYMRNDQ